MGRGEQRALESRLSVLLAHLLKWRHRPEPAANKGRALTIEEQRRRTRRALEAKSRFETDVGRDPCGGLRRREAPGCS